MTTVTYAHSTAGSVVHLQKPKRHKDDPQEAIKTATFHGPKGGIGYYSTDNPDEIDQLDYLAQHPQVPVTRVEAPLQEAVAAVTQIDKPADPSIQQARQDTVEAAARSSDPAVISASERLSAILAANKQ